MTLNFKLTGRNRTTMATLSTLMSVLLIPLIHAQITTRECVRDRECTQEDITADQIDCTGFYSCQGSSLTSRNRQNGYIDCSGWLSCASPSVNKNRFPSILKASSNIYCSGTNSCWQTGGLDSKKNIYCTAAPSCSEADGPFIAGNNMYCYGGRHSCAGADIQIGKKAFCGGIEGCYSGTITGGIAVHCDGQNGCSNTELSGQRRFICCAGSAGCQRSIISNVKEIRGYGYGALDSATINGGVETIKAYGYRSLNYASIDTDSDSIITIQV